MLVATVEDYKWIDFPMVSWAGWYDIFLMPQLVNAEGLQKYSRAAEKSHLVVDPLGHCQGGGCAPSAPVAEPYDCDAGFANWMQGWSVAKKAWCCSNKGKGCPPAAGGCA